MRLQTIPLLLNLNINMGWRALLACIGGYLSTVCFTSVLTDLLTYQLPHAQAIFLASFVGIFFFVLFFLASFALKRAWILLVVLVLFYLLSLVMCHA